MEDIEAGALLARSLCTSVVVFLTHPVPSGLRIGKAAPFLWGGKQRLLGGTEHGAVRLPVTSQRLSVPSIQNNEVNIKAPNAKKQLESILQVGGGL